MKKNINDLSIEEKANLMRAEFEKKSRFENLFNGQSEVKISCEEFYQKFREKIGKLLVEKKIIDRLDFPLEELHLHIPQEMRDYNFNDGVNKISTLFYENDLEFSDIYFDFVKNFLRKKFDFPFYFQTIPTIRIHCPNAKNSDHYPRYHTDIQYGHPVQEINLWFAFTKPVGEQKHGFMMANIEDSLAIYREYDYHFNNLIKSAINDKGFTTRCQKICHEVDSTTEILAFDSRCIHSGEPLLEHTRISIDVRIIPVEDYDKMPIIYQGAGRRKILFTAGECYHQLSSDKL